MFDIYTIIFLALAVFIFFRLRSVLGQRTGRERPPYDPYSARDAVRSPANDKIVTLPQRPSEPAVSRPAESTAPAADRWKGVAETGSSVAAGLDAIAAADGGFDAAIGERESRGETAETRFVSIDGSTITAADLRARTAQIRVRFVSQLISVTRDKSDNVIDGSPDKVTDVTDVWTFAREVSSRDPNWKVVATEAGQ